MEHSVADRRIPGLDTTSHRFGWQFPATGIRVIDELDKQGLDSSAPRRGLQLPWLAIPATHRQMPAILVEMDQRERPLVTVNATMGNVHMRYSSF